MKISELLDIRSINPNLTGRGKVEILQALVSQLSQVCPRLDPDDAMRVLLDREELGSTGIGDGVAIPHGKVPGLDSLRIAFGRHAEGVDFDSMDGRPAHLFFLLLAPEHEVNQHLKALARISKLLRRDEIRRALLAATDAEALYSILTQDEDGQ